MLWPMRGHQLSSQHHPSVSKQHTSLDHDHDHDYDQLKTLQRVSGVQMLSEPGVRVGDLYELAARLLHQTQPFIRQCSIEADVCIYIDNAPCMNNNNNKGISNV